jgi:hypothetical protein
MDPVLQPGRPGTELRWAWLNALLRMCRTNTIILGPNCGLEMIKSEGVGTALRTTPSVGGKQLAVTNGTITAAIDNSGSCTNTGSLLKTIPGAGSVFAMAYDGTCLVADTSTTPIPVLSYSTTTGGIASGIKVWIEINDNDGQWYITSVDCGN